MTQQAETDTHPVHFVRGFVKGPTSFPGNTIQDRLTFEGAVPSEVLKERVFNWTAVKRRSFLEFPATFETMTQLNELGEPVRLVLQEDLVGITHSETDQRLHIAPPSYTPHQAMEWLVDLTEMIAGTSLEIAAGGGLKKWSTAFVQFTVPELLRTPDGVEYRPFLTAATSFDGSMRTKWTDWIDLVVCGNQVRPGFREAKRNGVQIVSAKHTRNSRVDIPQARKVLNLLDVSVEHVTKELAKLCATTVTDNQFNTLVQQLVPLADDATTRSANTATRHRNRLEAMWRWDSRVEPWKNTAFGVAQAFNTYNLWERTVRNTTRTERNLINAITGTTFREDAKVLDALAEIIGVDDLTTTKELAAA